MIAKNPAVRFFISALFWVVRVFLLAEEPIMETQFTKSNILRGAYLQDGSGFISFVFEEGWYKLGLNGKVMSKRADLRDMQAFAFSPDNSTIAVGGHGTIKLLDYSLKDLRTISLAGEDALQMLAFSPDGKMLAAAGARFSLIDLASGKFSQGSQAYRNFSFGVFRPDGRSLVVNQGTALGVVDLNGKMQKRINDSQAFVLAVSPDGSLAITADEKAVFDIATGEKYSMGSRDAASAAFTPDGKRIAVGHYFEGQDDLIIMTDNHGQVLEVLVTFSDEKEAAMREKATAAGNSAYLRVSALSFSTDGKTLAAFYTDGWLRLYRVGGIQTIASFFPQLNTEDMAWAVRGNTLWSIKVDGTYGFWENNAWKRVGSAPSGVFPTSLAAAPWLPTSLLAAGEDGAIYKISLSGGPPEVFAKSSGMLILALTATGQQVVAATENRTLLIFDQKGILTKQLPLPGKRPLWYLSASVDNRVAGSDSDGYVYVWDNKGILVASRNLETDVRGLLWDKGVLWAQTNASQPLKVWAVAP